MVSGHGTTTRRCWLPRLQWAQKTKQYTVFTDGCRQSCTCFRTDIFIKWNVLCLLKAGIHIKGGVRLLDKHPADLCSHTREWPIRAIAQCSVDSSLLTARTYITVLKTKINHHKLECGVDELPLLDLCSLSPGDRFQIFKYRYYKKNKIKILQ